jgi:hypothetical protein
MGPAENCHFFVRTHEASVTGQSPSRTHCECYNRLIVLGAFPILPAPIRSRGVAQPGRAPGSGPGGRRFKSSLPDQSFL